MYIPLAGKEKHVKLTVIIIKCNSYRMYYYVLSKILQTNTPDDAEERRERGRKKCPVYSFIKVIVTNRETGTGGRFLMLLQC